MPRILVENEWFDVKATEMSGSQLLGMIGLSSQVYFIYYEEPLHNQRARPIAWCQVMPLKDGDRFYIAPRASYSGFPIPHEWADRAPTENERRHIEEIRRQLRDEPDEPKPDPVDRMRKALIEAEAMLSLIRHRGVRPALSADTSAPDKNDILECEVKCRGAWSQP